MRHILDLYNLDNLSVGELNKLDPLVTPRCTLFTNDLIKTLELADVRRDGSGRTRYGNHSLKSIIGTCYQELPPPPVAPAAAPAPPLHAAPQDHALSSSVHAKPQAHIFNASSNHPRQVFPSLEATFGAPLHAAPQDHAVSSSVHAPPQAHIFNASSNHPGLVFPSLEATLSGVIADLVSQDKRKDVEREVKKFDDDMRRASEIMSNAHNEAFLAIGRLLDEARNDNNQGSIGQDFFRVDHDHSSVHPNASMPPQVPSPIGPTHVDPGRDGEEHYDNSLLYPNSPIPPAPHVTYEGVQSVAANPNNAGVAKVLANNTYKRRKTTTAADVNKKEAVSAEQKKELAVAATKKQDEDEAVTAAATKKKDEEAAGAQKEEGEALAQKKEAEAAALAEKNKEDEAAAALIIVAILFS